MWIEIFKTGCHTDSKGSNETYTAESLENIAYKYNAKVAESADYEAPVVKGHPTTNEPAYGWVERLARRGNILLAKLKNLSPEIIDEIRKGLFKKVSIALYPDLLLRHIGLLGAVPPAIVGLRSVSFSDVLDFNEYEDVSCLKPTLFFSERVLDIKSYSKLLDDFFEDCIIHKKAGTSKSLSHDEFVILHNEYLRLRDELKLKDSLLADNSKKIDEPVQFSCDNNILVSGKESSFISIPIEELNILKRKNKELLEGFSRQELLIADLYRKIQSLEDALNIVQNDYIASEGFVTLDSSFYNELKSANDELNSLKQNGCHTNSQVVKFNKDLLDRLETQEQFIKQINKENEDLKKKLKDLEKESRLGLFREFANSLLERPDGSVIMPSQVNDLIDLLEIAYQSDSLLMDNKEFSDANSYVAKLKSFISGFKPVFITREFATKASMQELCYQYDESIAQFDAPNVSPERLLVHKKAKELQANTPELSYEEAVCNVLGEDL